LIFWAALFGFVAWRAAHRRSLYIALGSAAAALLLVGMAWPQASIAAFEAIERFSGLVRNQLQSGWSAAVASFPFGSGVGRVPEYPNGIAALAMEFGVLGFIGFATMILPAAQKRSDGRLPGFVIASVPFMVSFPLYRDRAFLLFLGIATGLGVSFLVQASSSRPSEASSFKVRSPGSLGSV
jgi:hypothetical protein